MMILDKNWKLIRKNKKLRILNRIEQKNYIYTLANLTYFAP